MKEKKSELNNDLHMVAECIAQWVSYILRQKAEGRRHFPDMFRENLTPNIRQVKRKHLFGPPTGAGGRAGEADCGGPHLKGCAAQEWHEIHPKKDDLKKQDRLENEDVDMTEEYQEMTWKDDVDNQVDNRCPLNDIAQEQTTILNNKEQTKNLFTFSQESPEFTLNLMHLSA